MTRIDFYTTDKSRLMIACKLVAKAASQKLSTTVFAPDQAVARAIDRYLWIYPQTAFIPHCFSNNPLVAETPTVIAASLENSGSDSLLINLSDEYPTAFGRYLRVIEIVSTEDGNQDSARNRWRQYKDRGYEVHHVNLLKGEAK